MQINVSSNASTVAKAIDAFSKNQIPFATHRALNDTAFAVRKEIVERTYPQSFVVKNRSFARAMFRVQRSPNKRTLTAAVFDQLGREYMVDQAEGGFKTPRGLSIAIPAQPGQPCADVRHMTGTHRVQCWADRVPLCSALAIRK